MSNGTQVLNEPIVCTQSSTEDLRFAIENRIPISGIIAVITHHGAHLEEILTMYYMMKTTEGQALFPGLKSCAFETEKNLASYRGEDGFYKALAGGYFFIGTLGGPFDEHDDRETKISSAELMANYLGLKQVKSGKLIYSSFLNYVNYEDRHGNRLSKYCDPQYASIIRPAIIADNVKKGWRLVQEGIKDGKALLDEVFGFIQNEIETQKLFAKAVENFQKTTPETIDLPFLPMAGKRKPVILVVESDDVDDVTAAKYVFSKNPTMEIKVLLKINTQGQFYIYPMNGTTLIDVIKGLRVLLAEERGLDPLSYEELVAGNKIEGLEELYYHKEADSIMNGSLTQYDTPGLIGKEFTKSQVIHKIVQALNPSYFGFYGESCKKGICPAKEKGQHCPLYRFHYEKCIGAIEN